MQGCEQLSLPFQLLCCRSNPELINTSVYFFLSKLGRTGRAEKGGDKGGITTWRTGGCHSFPGILCAFVHMQQFNCTGSTSVSLCTDLWLLICRYAHLLPLGIWPLNKQENMKHGCGGVFFFIQSLKRKLWVFQEGFFQVIHFIVVADERASNRAVANALSLSCLARDFLLSLFFFLSLPLALPFWY